MSTFFHRQLFHLKKLFCCSFHNRKKQFSSFSSSSCNITRAVITLITCACDTNAYHAAIARFDASHAEDYHTVNTIFVDDIICTHLLIGIFCPSGSVSDVMCANRYREFEKTSVCQRMSLSLCLFQNDSL